MKCRKNDNVEVMAYKFRIYPNKEQLVMLSKTFGCTRYLWNRMLADHNELYRVIGQVPDNTPADYKCLDECKWLNEVDSTALAYTQITQKRAFANFFNKKAQHPVFHKKYGRQSFTSSCVNNNIKLTNKGLKLPKISGMIKINCHRKIKDSGKLKSVTITKEVNGYYYASILYEYPVHTFTKEHVYNPNPKTIGLDMKLGELYIDSDGNSANMPDFYRLQEAKLAREQAKLSHMQKGSNNYKRQRLRINRLHTKIKMQRLDFLRKTAHKLASEYDVICVEDLNLKGMSSRSNYILTSNGKHLTHGKSVHSAGYGMFVNWLKWDCHKSGSLVVAVDKYYSSTQLCSVCGHKQTMDISDRVYICPSCSAVIDRDYNSAINIKAEGLRIYHKQNKTA